MRETRAVAKLSIALAGLVVAGSVLSAPAFADPTEDPCGLAVSFFCRFIPMAPELDGNVDLTTQLPPVEHSANPPESLPPADFCATGCV
jgi:hypothetical protein